MVKRFFMKSPVLKVTKRKLHILINERSWQEKGAAIKAMREGLGITVADMAKHLGISAARVKRFEAGEPVNDAKLLESAYRSHFKYLNLSRIIRESINI